jgi:hypothetical protein
MKMTVVLASLVLLSSAGPVSGQSAGAPLSVEDVITLHQAGLSESLLLTRVRQAQRPELSTDDLLALAEAKVPETVIDALLQPPSPPAGTTAPAPAPADRATDRRRAAPAATASAATSPDITVRPVTLPRKALDARRRELEAESSADRPRGLTSRLSRTVTTTIMGDGETKRAAEDVLQIQAHSLRTRENATVVVVIGGEDVVAGVRDTLSEFSRRIVLLHLDPSLENETIDNTAIHDGIAGGLSGLAQNVWVYLPRADAGASAAPDHTISSRAPRQAQVWTAIFTADGDTPAQLDNLLR